MPEISGYNRAEAHERYCQEYMIDCHRILAVCRTRCYKAREYVLDENGDPTELYDEVPLDPRNPKHRRIASEVAKRLHSYPQIEQRIDELRAQYKYRCILDRMALEERLRHIAFDFEVVNPTVADQISALKEIGRILNVYSEENRDRNDAIGEMFKTIFGQHDTLPKLHRLHGSDSRPTDTQGAA